MGEVEVGRWRVCGSLALTHERVAFAGICTFLFLLLIVKEWKLTGGCCDCFYHFANILLSKTLLFFGEGGLGREGGKVGR